MGNKVRIEINLQAQLNYNLIIVKKYSSAIDQKLATGVSACVEIGLRTVEAEQIQATAWRSGPEQRFSLYRWKAFPNLTQILLFSGHKPIVKSL